MSENSFMSLFSDPSGSDMFGSLGSGDDGFMPGLQPSLVTSVSSSYQPLEADSIMTLGEPSPVKPGPGGGGGGGGGGGMSYAQLGGMPSGYGSMHSSYQQPQHNSPQRFPQTPSYFSPGSSVGFPSQQQQQQLQHSAQPNHLQTPRYGHDPYQRQPGPGPSYQGYPGMHSGSPQQQQQQQNSSPSNLPGSWGSTPSASQQQYQPMRHYAPQGFGGVDPQQFLSHSQQQYGGPQGMQAVRGMMHGYAPQMQQHFAPSNGQYSGYPPQQQLPPGMSQQRMPYGSASPSSQSPGRYPGPSGGNNAPSSSQQQQQQSPQQTQQRPQGMYSPAQRQQDLFQASQNNTMQPPSNKQEGKMQPSEHMTSLPSLLSRPAASPLATSIPAVGDHYGPPSQGQRNQQQQQPTARSPAPLPPSSGLQELAPQRMEGPARGQQRPRGASPASPLFQPQQLQADQQHVRMGLQPNQNGAPNQSNGMVSPPSQMMMGGPQHHPGQPPQPQNTALSRMPGPPVPQYPQPTRPPMPPQQQQQLPGMYLGPPNHPQQQQYQNGSRMLPPMGPSPSGMMPPAGTSPIPNINFEIHEMQSNLKTYTDAGEDNPEVSKKIIEVKGRLEGLLRHQAATAGYPTGPGVGVAGMRMPYPQQTAGPTGIGLHRVAGPAGQQLPGMMSAQGPIAARQAALHHGTPVQPHQMRPQGLGLDGAGLRSTGPAHGSANSPMTQNGYVSNGLPTAEAPTTLLQHLQSAPVSPKQTDAFGNELNSSQDSDDEMAANKYASPKKKRIRVRKPTASGASGRKRKTPTDKPEKEKSDSPAKGSPAKSRSRSRKKKAKSPPVSTFQFGKKKKKRAGSDDEGDDVDATPPPSPRSHPVVEQDFDGNYVEKRRSTRVTKRRKYIDDDGDMSDLDDLLPGEGNAFPAVPAAVAVAGRENDSQSSDVQQYEATIADPGEPSKSFFVEPGDPEPIVVEKIMEHRIGQRPVAKVQPAESADQPDPAKTAEDKENGEEAAKKAEEPVEMLDVEEFHVKFKSYSYLHCDWKTLEELEHLDKRIKQKVTRYRQKKEGVQSMMEQADDEPFDPNFTEVERVLDEREFPDGEDLSKKKRYFLCKWMGLPYDECTWEVEEDSDTVKIAEFRVRQVPPPPAERKRVNRPTRNSWKQMDKGMIYKGGNTIRDYQLEGVNWLLFCWHNKQNCILADEMGLGKTVQSTVFLEHVRRYGIRGPFLVVVPLSTLGNWSREVETWTDMNGICYHGGSNTREIIREYEFYYRNNRGHRLAGIHKFNVFITTYEILLSDLYELKEIEWRAIVIDEAHRLKNKNCKLLEGLKLLNVEHRVLLTGTPLQNNVEELFSLLHFLEPERFSNAEAFSDDFGNLKTDDQVTKLQQILKPMMLRRLKEDVEKSIAPKEETIIEVELTNMQKKWYRAILEKNFTFLQKGTSSANVPNLMNTMMELRKCCNHPYLLNGAEDSIIDEFSAQTKPPVDPQDPELLARALIQSSGKLVLIDKLFPKLKDGGHKVLVFSQMVRCLDILEDYLVQKRYLFERIDGRVRGPDRQAAIDRFSREDSDRFVFLLCTRAGGLGINLTAADTVIIFDSDWNPQNDLQAQARCHRIGQNKAVKVYRLITRNSYEREMFDKASLKLGLDRAVLQSGQMSGGREAFNSSQQPLSKTDIEDLLKRGAYGALMDDDAAADQFCTEDIDQILQRRTQTVQLEAGEKGSTFSKASFAATGTRDDIDINDPDFWQKWAKKAEVSTDKDAFENDLIIHEPRRRLQVRRYGEELEEEPEEASDEDYDTDEEGGKGKKGGRKGRKGRKEEDPVRPGNWQRTECLRLEKSLLAWGWGRWKEILKDCQFKRTFTEKDVEIFGRTLVHHCCKQYCGSDDKAKPYIWNLVLKAYVADWEARKEAQKAKEEGGGEVPEQQPSTSKARSKSKKSPGKTKAATPEPVAEPENGALPDWESDERYDPEKHLDVSFLKHMKKHSVNRMILRLKLLENLKEEVIQDLGPLIMSDVPFETIPLEIPAAEQMDKPVDWWDDDADKCLLIGAFKHGYERYSDVRNDPKLCFLTKCGGGGALVVPDPEKDPEKEEPKEVVSDTETADTEDAPEAESTDAETEAGDARKKKPKSTTAKEPEDTSEASKPAVKTGRGRRPGPQRRPPASISDGQVNFPTDPDLNTRVRRLIVAFEKRRIRAELMEVKRQQRVEKQVQLEKEKEAKRLEAQQKKWSKREEADFFRAVSAFGVDYGDTKEMYEWDRFREYSKLEKKLDKTLTEYYKCFLAMLRKVCGKKLTRDEESAAAQIEPLAEDKAHRCLQRIELLYRIRVTALRHARLEDRLKLCQTSPDLPNWWITGQHDKELLEGAAKHGLLDTACNIAVDSDYTFADCIKSSINGEVRRASPSKMESLLKREVRDTSVKVERKPVNGKTDCPPVAVSENGHDEVKEKTSEPAGVEEAEQPPPSTTNLDETEEKVSQPVEVKEPSASDLVVVSEGEAVEPTLEKDAVSENITVEEAKPDDVPDEPKEAEIAESVDVPKSDDAAAEPEAGDAAKPEPREENVEVITAGEDAEVTAGIAAEAPEKTASVSAPVATKEGDATKASEEPPAEAADSVRTDQPKVEEATPTAAPTAAPTASTSAASRCCTPPPPAASKEVFVETENPHELTVAQLLAKGAYAKGWPSDRVCQARLEHICYCVEQNRWPSKRSQATMAGAITEEPSAAAAAVATPAPPPQPLVSGQFAAAESFMENPDFAMLAAAGHIPGLNGSADQPKRRRGRRPRVEIEAERMAQFHAAHQALLAVQQQQALLNAATASKGRRTQQAQAAAASGRGAGSSSNRRSPPSDSRPPPPAHHREASKQSGGHEVEGVLDLTGPGKSRKEPPPTSASPASSSSSQLRKGEAAASSSKVPEKGSKLSQKVDTLLKKRKQETEQDIFDPDTRIPMINMRDGSILQGDKAPKHKDLAQWMKDHPHYIVDTSGWVTGFGGLNFAEGMANGAAMPSSSKRGALDDSHHPAAHLSGEENVAVINRKTGKKLTGRKAPQLKNLADFLETNKNFDIDPSWTDTLKEQGSSSSSKNESSSAKRARKDVESPPNLFGAASPFGSAFPMGFPGRPLFPFPGLAGFPGMAGFPGLGMMPGMQQGDEEAGSSKSESPSGAKKGESSSSGNKDSAASTSGSSRRKTSQDKLDKEKNQQQQQQQAMESMLQSQLPFIFPQPGMFSGLHPLFSQGFAGMPGGFPFAAMMNGGYPGAAEEAEPAPAPSAKKPSVRDRGSDRDKERESQKKSSSSSSRRTSESPANYSSSRETSSRTSTLEKSRPSSSSPSKRHSGRDRDTDKDGERDRERSRRSERSTAAAAAAKNDSDDEAAA